MDIEQLKAEVDELKDTVECHDVDLYRGKDRDNPSITTRLALLEDWMKTSKSILVVAITNLVGIIYIVVKDLILKHQ